MLFSLSIIYFLLSTDCLHSTMNPLINCDIGEKDTVQDMDPELELLPYIDMANIACGGHAGSAEVIRAMMEACAQGRVRVGAHPSYPDREQFGRVSRAADVGALRGWLSEQLVLFRRIADELGVTVHHVKPHGALYHDAYRSQPIAQIVVEVTHAILGDVAIVGPARSALEASVGSAGLPYLAEAFADRRYTTSLDLQSRTVPGSVLSANEALMQVQQLLTHGTIETPTGPQPVHFQTLCVHSDSPDAKEILTMLHPLIHK